MRSDFDISDNPIIEYAFRASMAVYMAGLSNKLPQNGVILLNDLGNHFEMKSFLGWKTVSKLFPSRKSHHIEVVS